MSSEAGPQVIRLEELELPLPVFNAAIWFRQVVMSFPELIDISRDKVTRVAHGIEHATIALLELEGFSGLSGSTRKSSFRLRLRKPEETANLKNRLSLVVYEAIWRVQNGERRLAYTTYCGTSAMIGITIYAVVGLFVGIIGLFAQIDPNHFWYWFFGLSGSMLILSPILGLITQWLSTVSTDFRDIYVEDVRFLSSKRTRDTVEVRLHIDV